MRKYIFMLSGVALLLSSVAFASFPFDSAKYLPPPTTVNLTFNRMMNADTPSIDRSGILNAITGNMSLAIDGNGAFYKTISIDNDRFSANEFAEGNAPEDGTFTLKGTYRKGHINAEWTYELNIPVRKGWKFTDTFSGSGTFYTTQVITEESGAGIIEGMMTRANTVWKDKKMVDHKQEVVTERINNGWVAVSSCQYVLCGCADQPDPVDSQARFNIVTGEVGYAHCNSSERTQEWIPATPKVKLLVNDHISTGQDSSAVLLFQDMTTFKMKPDTEVIVKSPPDQETKLGLVSGHLWINFKKMLTNGTMEVEMGQAVAGIKGTTLVLEEKNGVSSLKVIEGTVSFTAKETGQTVDVLAGEAVSADFNGLSAVEKFDVAKESSEWEKLEEVQIAGDPSASESEATGDGRGAGVRGRIALATIITLAIVIGGVWVARRKR